MRRPAETVREAIPRTRERTGRGVPAPPAAFLLAALLLCVSGATGCAGRFASEAEREALDGRITLVEGDFLVLEKRKRASVELRRGDDTKVEGRKNRWEDLAPGDIVVAAWEKGLPPQEAIKIIVYRDPRELRDRPRKRTVGRIEEVTDEYLLLANEEPPRKFVRTGRTRVENERQEWGELEKGDRVIVQWRVGPPPRKAERVHVSLRAGYTPLQDVRDAYRAFEEGEFEESGADAAPE